MQKNLKLVFTIEEENYRWKKEGKLQDIVFKEEICRRQRSGLQLKPRDSNVRFYHNFTNGR